MSPDPVGTEQAQPQQAGSFLFQRFIVRKAIFEQVPRLPRAEGETKPNTLPGEIDLGVNFASQDDPPHGMVTLSITVRPDLKWQPYRIEVTVSGVFGSKGATPELFELFCRQAVPSILFPYVRTLVHSMTMDASFGPIRLHPMNLSDMLAKAWGAKQMLEHPAPIDPSEL